MQQLITILAFMLGSLLFTHDAHAQFAVERIDINPGTGHSNPTALTQIDTTLYFQADDGIHGAELWASDGTVSGTHMIKDIYPGIAGSEPLFFTKHNGKVYFAAQDSAHGRELWVTDGTANGTQLVKDIQPGNTSSGPLHLFAGRGKLFFSAQANTSSGFELFVSDGSTSGTKLLKEINTKANTGSHPGLFQLLNNKVIFRAEDTTYGIGPWVTDGTTNGTIPLQNTNSGDTVHMGSAFTLYNNRAYFQGNSGYPDYNALWYTDGTPNGTIMAVNPIQPSTSKNGVTTRIIKFNNRLFLPIDSSFLSTDLNPELWTSDGTDIGTRKVKEIHPGIKYGGTIWQMTPADSLGLLFFQAYAPSFHFELWATDGTTNGTRMVKDIAPGFEGSYPSKITPYGNHVFFIALDSSLNIPQGEFELWVTDGTDTGTRKLIQRDKVSKKGINIAPYDSITVCNKLLFMSAHFDTTGNELWIVRDTLHNPYQDTTNPPQYIASIQSNKITIAPNPAHNSIHINFDMAIQNATISLTDISGKVLRKEHITDDTKEHQLNISGIAPGAYILSIKTDTYNKAEKILIE